MEFNKVFLIGNLTRDPESRFLQNGSQVVKMGLAVNRRTGKEEGKEEVLFIDIECWNKTAELCAQYLKKGSQILVEGRLKLDQYQTQSGENRQKILVVADRVQFGARPQGQGGGDWGGGAGGRGQQSGGGNAPRRENSGGGQRAPQDDAYPAADPTNDDLPF